MTLRSSLLLAAAGLAAALALSVSAPALAAGSSDMPSQSSSSSMPAGQNFDPVKRYQEGVAALQASKFKDAQRAFGEVLKVAARDPATNFMMGLSILGQDNYQDSRKYLEKAVKYNPDLAEARGWLGVADVKAGEPDKAAEQKTALVAMQEKCAGTCKEAGEIDLAIKRIDAAAAKPAAALTLGLPKLASAEGDAAYLTAYGLINEGRYTEALASLREAALVFGPHADVLTYEGFANRKLGNYRTAVAFYGAALALNPNHRGANEYLGEYYVEIGDMARARGQLTKLQAICKFGCEEADELHRWIDGKRT